MAMSIACASSYAKADRQARSGDVSPCAGRSWRTLISIPGAACRSSARSGGRNTADAPSGAPIVNRRSRRCRNRLLEVRAEMEQAVAALGASRYAHAQHQAVTLEARAEAGAHDELVERAGVYARLFETQAKPYR